MKPGTFTELGKLLLNAGLAVFIAAIIQPLVTVTNPPKIDYGVILGGILGVTFLIGIGLMLLEKGGGNV
ncbi:MAG: hypothetical protein ACYCVG_05750 [Leptospirillum sp.]|jgi:hypothetical protein